MSNIRRTVYGTFGENSKLTLDSNWAHAIHDSLLLYTKDHTYRSIASRADGTFHDRVIDQWYHSEYSKRLLSQLKTYIQDQRVSIPSLPFDWSIKFTPFTDPNNPQTVSVGTPISYKGDTSEGGLLGLVKNLVRAQSKISSHRMSKSAGSGDKHSREFLLEIKPIGPARYDLYHGPSTVIATKHYGTLEVSDPPSNFHYCTAKVLDYLLEHCVNGRRAIKKLPLIVDSLLSVDELLNQIQTLQDNHLLTKNIKVVSISHTGDNTFWHTKELLKNFNRLSSLSKRQYVYVIVDIQNKHVSIGTRRDVGQYAKKHCTVCNRDFVVTHFDGHLKSCAIRVSRSLDNLAIGRKQYLGRHVWYSIDSLERDYADKYTIVSTEFVSEKRSIIITGPGGNGKSFIIKNLLADNPECNFWMLAPTGVVAADYEGGSTWQRKLKYHMLTLDYTLEYLMTHPHDLDTILNSVWDFEKPDGIIFDEFSMIKGQDICFIEYCCRRYFKSDLPWGGIPFLGAGDPAQLPPVDTDTCFYDLPVCASPIARVRQYGCVITLDAPRRLMQGCLFPDGRVDMDTVNIQSAHLADIRVGHVTSDFIDYLKPRHLIDTGPGCLFNDTLMESFDTGQNIIITLKNTTVAKLVQRKYHGKGLSLVGRCSRGFKLLLFRGMRLMICDNDAIEDDLVFNGSSCIVSDFKKNVWVDLEFPHGIFRLHVGVGRNTLSNRFALGYYYIRTIHKCQGSTITGNVYYYGDGPSIDICTHPTPGLLYVAFSRATNLENLYIVTSNKYSLTDHINPVTCNQLQVNVKVVDDSTVNIAYDIKVHQDGGIQFRDTSSWNGCKTFKNNAIKNKTGLHNDYLLQENERIFDNTINVDHETGGIQFHDVEKHRIIYTAPLWIFNGQVTDFREFILRNGGSLDGLVEYKRLESGHMEFSFLQSADPGRDYLQYIIRILNMVQNDLLLGRNSSKGFAELHYFHEHPMIDVGYNNLGFDIRFLLQHSITDLPGFTVGMIQAGGSNLKHVSIHYSDERCAYKVYDLMSYCGVGSLASKISSFVTPLLHDRQSFMTLHSKIWLTGIGPFGTSIVTDMDSTISCSTSEWENLTIECKQQLCKEWFILVYPNCGFMGDTMNSLEEDKLALYSNEFALRCLHAGIRDEQLLSNVAPDLIKKGCVPLKYMGTLTCEEYNQSTCIDLLDIMIVNGEIDWSIAFFPREIQTAKQMLIDLGESFFREYHLIDEMRSYAVNDVCLNECLLRIVNNVLYSYGDSLPAVNIHNSWGGLRLSVFRFPTTASLAGHMAWVNLPPRVFYDNRDDLQLLKTRLSLPPIEMDPLIAGIAGGKTQARCAHFISSDPDTDYCSYVDKSGMYMAIQKNCEYPYGCMKFYRKDTHSSELEYFKQLYDDGGYDSDLFIKCRIFEFKGHHDPREIENVLATKDSFKLEYNSLTKTFTAMQSELEMFKLYGGTVLEMITVVEWEHQCKMFESIMTFYDTEKQKAEASGNSVLRTQIKLGANATFGLTAKSDKPMDIVMYSNPEDLLKLHAKYPGGLLGEQEWGGFFVAKGENTNRTITQNPSYLGRFTLGYSKKMLYSALYIAHGGINRFRIENLGSFIKYGDTDSAVLPRKCLDLLMAYDETVPICDRKLYCQSYGTLNKAGKFTDELADDTKKYVGKEYATEISKPHRGYPHYGGFHPRIIHCFNPASKSGGNHILFPPLYWPCGRETTWADYPPPSMGGWISGYKCFAKGVSSTSVLSVKLRSEDVLDGFTSDEEGYVYLTEGISHTKRCFDLLEYAYKWNIQLSSKRPGTIMKRYLFVNQKARDKGVYFADILNIQDPGRSIWGRVNTGRRLLLHPDYREKHYSEWVNRGFTMYELSDGVCLPNGYKNGSLDYT